MKIEKKYNLLELLPAVTVFVLLILVSLSMNSLAGTSDSESIFADRDQDGLSDEEEEALGTDPLLMDTDGDSYSDGVEVESGYDPLIAAPYDRIDSLNMGGEDPALSDSTEGDSDANQESATETFTSDLAGYLQESIEEGNEEISVDELTAIADASVEESITYEDLPEIDMENIQIKEQDYANLSEDESLERHRQDAIEYFTGSAFILSAHLPTTPGGSTELTDIMDHLLLNMNTIGTSSPSPYLVEMADSSDAALQELQSIEVPEEYLDVHIQGLQLATYGSSLGKNIKMSETDPLSTISTLSQIQGLFSLSSEYVSQMTGILNDIQILEQDIDL